MIGADLGKVSKRPIPTSWPPLLGFCRFSEVSGEQLPFYLPLSYITLYYPNITLHNIVIVVSILFSSTRILQPGGPAELETSP